MPNDETTTVRGRQSRGVIIESVSGSRNRLDESLPRSRTTAVDDSSGFSHGFRCYSNGLVTLYDQIHLQDLYKPFVSSFIIRISLLDQGQQSPSCNFHARIPLDLWRHGIGDTTWKKAFSFNLPDVGGLRQPDGSEKMLHFVFVCGKVVAIQQWVTMTDGSE